MDYVGCRGLDAAGEHSQATELPAIVVIAEAVVIADAVVIVSASVSWVMYVKTVVFPLCWGSQR